MPRSWRGATRLSGQSRRQRQMLNTRSRNRNRDRTGWNEHSSARILYDAATADYFMPVSASGCITVSEGAHYVTPMGGNNGGLSLWDLCCSAITRG